MMMKRANYYLDYNPVNRTHAQQQIYKVNLLNWLWNEASKMAQVKRSRVFQVLQAHMILEHGHIPLGMTVSGATAYARTLLAIADQPIASSSSSSTL